jgi:hypothetical protein
MKRVLMVLTMLAVFALPRPALAQDRYCAVVDFRETAGGMTVDIGSYVAGEGYRTTYTTIEMLYLTYTGQSVSVDEITILWYVELWGGGAGAPVASMIRIGGGEGTILETWASTGEPATQFYTWLGEAEESGNPLEFHLYASNFDGSSSAVAYLRSMSVCGSVLPAVWNPVLEGAFVDPWPTDTGWTRATPTPWPTPDATPLPFALVDTDAGNLADNAINVYRFVNQQGIVDTLIWLVMLVLIISLIFRFMRKAKAEG